MHRHGIKFEIRRRVQLHGCTNIAMFLVNGVLQRYLRGWLAFYRDGWKVLATRRDSVRVLRKGDSKVPKTSESFTARYTRDATRCRLRRRSQPPAPPKGGWLRGRDDESCEQGTRDHNAMLLLRRRVKEDTRISKLGAG